MAVPFFLLAVVVLVFFAGPIKQNAKSGGARTQVEPELGGAQDATPPTP